METEYRKWHQQPDWREEFEQEVIRRSGASDEEKARGMSPYEPPEYVVRQARERDEHVVTSRELLDLHKLHSQVKDAASENRSALAPYFEDLLQKVWTKLLWALEKLLEEERKESQVEVPFVDYGIKEFTWRLESFKKRMEDAASSQRMMLVDELVHEMHIQGPIARYLVRDFRGLTDKEIKNFFDKLAEY